MKDLQKIKEFFSKPLEENQPQFKKGDKVTYLGYPAEITAVNKEMTGEITYGVAYDKGQGRTKASNINPKSGAIKPLKEALNPEVISKVNRFIKALANHYDYSEQDAVYAIMQALRTTNFQGINEAMTTAYESKSISDYKVGDILKFKDGEDWKVMKVKDNVGKLIIKPHNEKAKEGNVSLEIDIDANYLKKNLLEAKEEDAVDTITMDIPLFLRMLEYAREDAEQDLDLHDVTEKANKLGKERGILQMDDYEEIVGTAEDAPKGEMKEMDYGSILMRNLMPGADVLEKYANTLIMDPKIASASTEQEFRGLLRDKIEKAQWFGKDEVSKAAEYVLSSDNNAGKYSNTISRVFNMVKNKSVNEGMGGELDEPFFIRVSVDDAQDAMVIFNDEYNDSNIKTYGSDVYAANTPEDIFDLYYDFISHDIEVLEKNVEVEDDENFYDAEYEKTLTETILRKLKSNFKK